MVALVIIAYITGGNPVRNGFEGEIHAASGMLIALLLLIRLPVRLILKKKIPNHMLPKWQHLLAQLVQVALYLCMILIPLTGLLALSEKTDSNLLWGMNLPLFDMSFLETSDIEIGDLHEAFIGLAGVHAALYLHRDAYRYWCVLSIFLSSPKLSQIFSLHLKAQPLFQQFQSKLTLLKYIYCLHLIYPNWLLPNFQTPYAVLRCC